MEHVAQKRLYLYLTKNCNTNCSYCYRKFLEKPTDIPNEMSYKVATDAINFIYKNYDVEPSFGINLWGGEPLLRFDLIKQLLTEYPQIGFSTNTNGSLITEEIYKFFLKQSNFTITWSIGNTWEKYGSIEEKIKQEYWAYRTIKDIPRNRMNLTVISRYDKLYEDFKEFFKINSVSISLAMHVNHKQEDLNMFAKQYFKVLCSYGLDAKTPVHVTNLWSRAFDATEGLEPEFCATGLLKTFVDTAGNIWSCDGSFMNQTFKLGNIYTGRDDSSLDYVKELQADKSKLLKYCEGCEIYGNCPENKCLNNNYGTTGDFLKPPKWHCDIQKTLYKTYEKYIEWVKVQRKGSKI